MVNRKPQIEYTALGITKDFEEAFWNSFEAANLDEMEVEIINNREDVKFGRVADEAKIKST